MLRSLLLLMMGGLGLLLQHHQEVSLMKIKSNRQVSQYFYDRTRTTDMASFVPGNTNKPSPLRKGFAAEDEDETSVYKCTI